MDQVDQEPYRSLSSAAVGALVVAVLSLSGLLLDALMALAIVAVILSTIALFRIRANSELAGRKLAIAALIIGCFVAATVSARVVVRRSQLQGTAQGHAETWLDTLAVDRKRAYELCRRQQDRSSEGADLETVYQQQATSDLGREFKDFFDDALVVRVEQAVHRQQAPRLVETLPPQHENAHRALVQLVYQLPDGERFLIVMERWSDDVGGKEATSWRVSSLHMEETT